MRIQSIGNNRINVKFSSDADTERAKAFVNMDDSQLKTLAYLANRDKSTEKKTKNSINSTLYALPIAASLSSGILTKGKLGTRVLATGKTAANWGFGLLVLSALNLAKKAVVSRSEKLQQLENNHPIISLIADLGLFMGVLALGAKCARNVGAKIFEKTPKTVLKLFTKLQNAKRLINKTKLNTKVLPSIIAGVAKIATRAPWAVAAGATIVANSVYILFLAGIIKGTKCAKQEQMRVENNFKSLKLAQLDTAKHLTNVLAEKNDTCVKGLLIAE